MVKTRVIGGMGFWLNEINLLNYIILCLPYNTTITTRAIRKAAKEVSNGTLLAQLEMKPGQCYATCNQYFYYVGEL